MARTHSPRVLVVEDHDSLRLYISAVLSKSGYRVVPARSEQDAIDTLSHTRVAAMFVDLDSLLLDSSMVLAMYRRQQGSQAPLVVCPPIEPGHGHDLSTAVLVRKPFSAGRLLDAFSQAIAGVTAARVA